MSGSRPRPGATAPSTRSNRPWGRSVREVTLIGVARLADKFLIGADGVVIDGPPPASEPHFLVPAPKLFTSASTPAFVWGYAGGQPVGEAFGRWLDQRRFTSWATATSDMKKELARLNGEARAQAEPAGATGTYEDVSVLAIASAFDEAHAVYLDEEGNASYKDDSVMFIGLGKSAAFAAWRGARRVGAEVEPAFRAAIETAIEVNPLLGPPADIREVPV